MLKKGLVRSWILKNLTISAIVFCLIVGLSWFALKSYFYGGIKQTLQVNIADMSYNITNSANTEDDFFTLARTHVMANAKNKHNMDIMVYDVNNNCVFTSNGFTYQEKFNNKFLEEYNRALNSENGNAYSIGETTEGEPILTVTQIAKNQIGEKIGTLRYRASLQKCRTAMRLILALIMLVFLFFTLIICFIDSYLMLSITNFLLNMRNIADKVAKGDFSIKLQSKDRYEMKEFCDTINKMIEELNNTETIKNDFISSVSHELRTPLTAIKGWAETLQTGDIAIDSETAQKAMNIIVRESERLSFMVEELLDFSRMQRKTMIYLPEKIDVIAELKETIYIHENRALRENKHIIFNDKGEIFFVWADKNRIKQVFGNIIDNSIKYTDAGGTITIIAKEENDEVAIIVNDNGCGIAEKDIPKVKNKFYKANKNRSGSGIGLAIVDEIVKYHSGRLVINSKEGEGTTVAVYLPIMKEPKNGKTK